MKFEELNELVPHVIGKKVHVMTMQPYPNITLAMPGRHQQETEVPGGDFVVKVTDFTMGWTKHQFTHTDLFQDLSYRPYSSTGKYNEIMRDYLEVVRGKSPVSTWQGDCGTGLNNVMNPQTLLYAVQCLAVCEHRRYARHEKKFGGRYLPFRFGAGIVEGLWTSATASDRQKKGRPGVEWLEKEFGVPKLTQELME